MIIVLLADGFEEIEALTPVDMLRRAGACVKTVGITGKIATGSHGIPIVCDLLPEEVDITDVTTVIFPGGMPGALNLDAAEFTDKIISYITASGGRLAAICAAPLVLGRRGLLKEKKATCYPGFEKELLGAKIEAKSVVTDGNITTAKGMGVSLDFAKELVKLCVSEEKANELSIGIMEERKDLDNEAYNEENDTSHHDEFMQDKQFIKAVEIALKEQKVSTSQIQRKLGIGYGKAATFIDVMEEMGIISEFDDSSSTRKILITAEEWKNGLISF